MKTDNSLFEPFPTVTPGMDHLMEERFGFWVDLASKAGLALMAHTHSGKPINPVVLANMLDDAKLPIPDPDTIPKAFWGDDGNKYLYVSEMQKAVRFGDPIAAARAAFTMLDHGQGSYMARRLAVIASEDVGLGDPYSALVAWAISKTKKLYYRKTLLLKLITRMCEAPKSRLVCDFSVIPYMSDRLKKQVYKDKALTLQERVELWNDPEQPAHRRLTLPVPLCGSALAGASYDPLPKKDAKKLDEFWAQADIPSLYHQLALAAEGGFGMAWPTAYLASMGAMSVGQDPWHSYFNPVKIGVLYAATFDKHTSIGKQAFYYVRKSRPDWFAMMPGDEEQQMNSFSRVIFYTEGSHLSPFLHGTNLTNLYWSILHEKWRVEGWTSNEEAIIAYQKIASDLMLLHKARSKVMGAPIRE